MNKKTTLVIGGSGGIGSQTAQDLAKKGYDIYLTYNKNQSTVSGLMDLKFPGKVSACQLDVTNEKDVFETFKSIKEKNELFDSVVYCVSAPLKYKKISACTWEDFQKHIDVQIKGMFCVVKAVRELMSQEKKMRFVVLLTEACIGKPPAMLSHYITAKYGLMGFVKAMQAELEKDNFSFNMISPGMVETDLLQNLPNKLVEIVAHKNPRGRIARPSDVSNAIAFLLSDEADYISGTNIVINGGNTFP